MYLVPSVLIPENRYVFGVISTVSVRIWWQSDGNQMQGANAVIIWQRIRGSGRLSRRSLLRENTLLEALTARRIGMKVKQADCGQTRYRLHREVRARADGKNGCARKNALMSVPRHYPHCDVGQLRPKKCEVAKMAHRRT